MGVDFFQNVFGCSLFCMCLYAYMLNVVLVRAKSEIMGTFDYAVFSMLLLYFRCKPPKNSILSFPVRTVGNNRLHSFPQMNDL